MLKEAQPDSLAPLENQLRSTVLKPSSPIGDICSKPEMIDAIVAEVVKKRSQFLAIDPSDQTDYQSLKSAGRLLVYEPSENVSDGASRCASQGFYDPSDAPPWDSWVHYSEGSLICWVPAALIPFVPEWHRCKPSRLHPMDWCRGYSSAWSPVMNCPQSFDARSSMDGALSLAASL